MGNESPKPKSTGCRACGQSVRGGGRGLCQKHYRRWKKKYETLLANDEASAGRFEADCIRDGWLKERSVGGRPPEDEDVFDAYAIRALADETQDIIAEGHSDLEAALREYKAKKVAENASKFRSDKRRKQG